ncbi:hypothetical protein, partial [Actinobacillus porcinus]|uniref:hypothetical protein n=1 Tax=Actinobacillus porcinus TaxID=51048 RepID=UPI002A9100AD
KGISGFVLLWAIFILVNIRVCLSFNKRLRRSLFFALIGQKRSPPLRGVPKKAIVVVVKLVNSPTINCVLRLADDFFRRHRFFLLKDKQTLSINRPHFIFKR